MRRAVLFGFGLMLLLATLSVAALVVLTNTPPGRERVRRFAVRQLNSDLAGSASVGNLDGNLLVGFSLGDVSIIDSAGAPVFSATRISGRYRALDLLRKRVQLSNVHIVRPRVVLQRSRDGAWNVSSLFREDTVARRLAAEMGWGDWVTLRNVTIEDGSVVLRAPWLPDTNLAVAARDSMVADGLNGGRLRLERSGNGFQRVMLMREIHAKLPHVRLADPDSPATAIEIATLRAIAEPFRAPPAVIRDLAAIVRLTDDSITIRDARIALPGSRINGHSAVARGGIAQVRARAEPVMFADLRWLYPGLPSEGGGSLDFTFVSDSGYSDFTASGIDLRSGQAALAGSAGARISDSTEIHDTDLRFSDVGTSLIKMLAPGVDIPLSGTLNGRAELAGTIRALRVDGDVTFRETRSGTSRLVATGEIGFANGFRVRDLRVRAMPLRMNLVKALRNPLPIDGVITGRATIDGAVGSAWRIDGDVTHLDRGERSRVAGRARVTGRRPKTVDADIRVLPLSLTTVGRFAPRLGLRGDVSGPIRLQGDLGNLVLDANLALPQGASLRANGHLGLSSDEPSYTVTVILTDADASSIASRPPETSLTGTINANGRGVNPATMRATIAADMAASRVGTTSIAALHAGVQLADGIATVDTLFTRAAGAVATASGTIGLTEERSGDLEYHVRVDTIASLARWIQGDTGLVRPRPWRQARALALARADSARVFEETRIEREAMGGTPPALVFDSIAPIPRDSLAGSIDAHGALKGSITRFDLSGRATLEDVVARGGAVNAGEIEYTILAAPTTDRSINAVITLAGVQVEGFAFDSLRARVAYSDSGGTVVLVLRQDERSSYRLGGDFSRRRDTTNILLRDLELRFDSTVWSATHQTAARFSDAGLTIDSLDLQSNAGGRIRLAADLPSQGGVAADLSATAVEIANVATLLQVDTRVNGTLTISARGEGTRASPRFNGNLRVANGRYRENELPVLGTVLEYADKRLSGNATLVRGDTTLASAEGSLPLDLALSGVSGPRLDGEGALTFDARSNDLPLSIFPSFSTVVENLTGRATATLAVRGTPKQPDVSGDVTVRHGSFRIPAANVVFSDVAASARIHGDTVKLDSLVARSGGTVRVQGTIGIATISRPTMALMLDADDLAVLGGRSGNIRADSHLEITGPSDDVLIAGNASVANGFFDASGPSGDAITLINSGDPALYAILDTSTAPKREPGLPKIEVLGNMRLDVGLHIDRNVWMRTAPDGNLEVFTAIDLGVRFDKRSGLWTFSGLVNTAGGDYTFQARRFTMARGSGSMSGTPGIAPVIQATGVHDVWLTGQEPIQLRIIISGNTDKPRITMEGSNRPPVTSEISQSYITFSRPFTSVLQQGGSSLSGASTAAGNLNGATGILARRQQASVAMGVITHEVGIGAVRSLYVDVFTVTPGDVPAEHSESRVGGIGGIVVTAGKLLDTETQISVQLRPATIYPGLRFQRRLWGHLLIDAGIEPRWVPTAPYLSADQEPRTKRAFGAFLTREWEF